MALWACQDLFKGIASIAKEKAAVKSVSLNILDHEENVGIAIKKTESLTFTIHHDDSIKNFNVIYSDISPALFINPTFDYHLEKSTEIYLLEPGDGKGRAMLVNIQVHHGLKKGFI